jgi:glycerate-2-kinase
MPKQWIQDFNNLAVSPERINALKVMQAGLDAIDTEATLKNQVRLEGSVLFIDGLNYNLEDYNKLYVLAFGKGSAKAAEVFEQIVGDKISDGVVISIREAQTKKIRAFLGTHPKPSMQNVNAAKEMEKLIKGVTEKDLVICLITGGGSALLCWDEKECELGKQLYDNYLKAGEDIVGLNTVRKHISHVKGGGLAQMLYPATVVGIIFSDVSGGRNDLVTSGPTYFDESTISDAKAIIDKYNLGQYELLETPKDKKYFEKVRNVVLVSNVTALEHMKKTAESLGVEAEIVSSQIYSTVPDTIKSFKAALKAGKMVLGGGEVKFVVKKSGGKGGRNMYFTMNALKELGEKEIVVSVDSDGLDNGDCAGVIIDNTTQVRLKESGLSLDQAIEDYNGYDLFGRLGRELIFTGPTQSNVSDLIIWYKYS